MVVVLRSICAVMASSRAAAFLLGKVTFSGRHCSIFLRKAGRSMGTAAARARSDRVRSSRVGWRSVTHHGAQQERTGNDASKAVGYASLTHPTKFVVPI